MTPRERIQEQIKRQHEALTAAQKTAETLINDAEKELARLYMELMEYDDDALGIVAEKTLEELIVDEPEQAPNGEGRVGGIVPFKPWAIEDDHGISEQDMIGGE